MGKRQSSIAWLDAFNDSPFKGNPAAVCFLEEKRDGQWLQAVAREFNVSETCYLTRHTDHESKIGDYSHSTIYPRFRLRWFTPGAEVKLCGHATLAASHYLFTSGLVNANTVEFLTLSGVLTAKRVPDAEKSDSLNFQIREGKECFRIELAFPMVPTVEFNCNELSAISKTLGSVSVMEIKKTAEEDLLVVLSSGKMVVELDPQFEEIQKFPGSGGIIVTGPALPGSGFDFISRHFCPKFGIN